MRQDLKNDARNIRSMQQRLKTLVVGIIGRISSGNTTRANAVGYSGVEYRDMRIIAPYGIAYCPVNDAEVQIVNNDGEIPVVVGVYDDKRPQLQPGELMLYSGNYRLLVSQTGIYAIKDDVVITII